MPGRQTLATTVKLHGASEASAVASDGGDVKRLGLAAFVESEIVTHDGFALGRLLNTRRSFHDRSFHVICSKEWERVVHTTPRILKWMTWLENSFGIFRPSRSRRCGLTFICTDHLMTLPYFWLLAAQFVCLIAMFGFLTKYSGV